MPTPPEAFAAVAQAVGRVSPRDAEEVRAFYAETLPAMPPWQRQHIIDFLIASETVPSAGELAALADVLKSVPRDFDDVSVAPFTPEAVAELPDSKPGVYEILSSEGRTVYVGMAGAGRLVARLAQHLGELRERVPGARVRVTQFPSVRAAREAEVQILALSHPEYNERRGTG